MPGIEEEDSSVLLGEDENLPRGGYTSQGKHGVSRLAEAGGPLIGSRPGIENQPRFFYNTVPTSKPSLPSVLSFHNEQNRSCSEEVRLFPVFISNFPRLTVTTDATYRVEVENLRKGQTVSTEKDPR